MVQTLFESLEPLSWTGICMKQRDPLSEPLIDTDLIDDDDDDDWKQIQRASSNNNFNCQKKTNGLTTRLQ